MRLAWLGVGMLMAQTTRSFPYPCEFCEPYTSQGVVRFYTEKLSTEGSFYTLLSYQGQSEEKTGDWEKEAQLLRLSEEWFPAQPIQLTEVLEEKGQTYQKLIFFPVQIHQSGKKIRIWKNFSYQLQATPFRRGHRQLGWVSESRLRQGTWYKIATGAPGVYKIDAALLRSLGIEPGTVDPKSLRIYGQKGGMLPQANSSPFPDDWVEIPVHFPGQSDGQWDENDAAYFYADDAHAWDISSNQYFHITNLFTDSLYFLIGFEGMGLRLSTASGGTYTTTTDKALGKVYYEKNLENLLKSGRAWLGERFENTLTYQWQMATPGAEGDAQVYIQVAAQGASTTTFQVRIANQNVGSISCNAIPGPADQPQARWGGNRYTIPHYGESLPVSLTYNRIGSAIGWLDFIEVIYQQKIAITQGQKIWDIPAQIGGVQIQARLEGSTPWVWDVTDPLAYRQVPTSISGNTFFWISAGDTLRRFCTWREEEALTPRPIGKMPNQNLHGRDPVDYVIVTLPSLVSAAEELAQFHRERGLSVFVTTPQTIYNEFSGGRPDFSALRNFLRMLYVRSGFTKPSYLLLLGPAHYDYRKKEQLFTYEARESFDPTRSFASDDYYTFLDDSEGFWGEGGHARWVDPRDTRLQIHVSDIGVGRLPASTLAEAQAMVRKSRLYTQTQGDWKSWFVLFADYKDGGLHVRDADQVARFVDTTLPFLDIQKIYLDSYAPQWRASGLFFPQAKEALISRIHRGALIIHYVGHGNTSTLQHNEFFNVADITQLQNRERLAFWITATCDWGAYDVGFPSAGMQILALPEKGAVGLLTSVRKVWAYQNFLLTMNFYRELSAQLPTPPITLGNLLRKTKNRSWGAANINTRSFALLGDPALPLGIPAHEVQITQVQGKPAGNLDTLHPLQKVTMQGIAPPSLGKGIVYLRLWDKPILRTTQISQTPYQSQEILLYAGRYTAQGGYFTATFYVPADILNDEGLGKITLYLDAPQGEARGVYRKIRICCPDTNQILQSSPPTLNLYLNTYEWVNGSLTDPNPLLIATVRDSYGISLGSLSVGRGLKAYLDENDPIFLETYYQGKVDSYQEGEVRYPFQGLSEGHHTLRVEVWNIAGKKAQAQTEFYVAEKKTLRLGRVFNYPNPFTTRTQFFFEHNQLGQELEVEVQIFSLTGRLVQRLYKRFTASSTLSSEIFWDGLDSFGDKLARGVYLYRLTLRSGGQTAYAQQKLVLLR